MSTFGKEVSFLVTITVITSALFMACYFTDDNVVRHVSGQGVLIQGTGCIINDVPEVSDEQMMAIAVFCITNRTH